MKKLSPLAALLAAVFCFACAACADEVIVDQVRCYSTWDETYLYLGFKVDCPDVQATHSTPNASVEEDAAVEFFIETDNRRSRRITPSCFSMAVSPAGGAEFRAGSAEGKLAHEDAFSFKYDLVVCSSIYYRSMLLYEGLQRF